MMLSGSTTCECATWQTPTGQTRPRGSRLRARRARTCGTQYAGWLSTPHPAAGEPPTPGVVCFDGDRASYEDCYISEEVEVCACAASSGTTTYLYRLPRPPRCYASYCGTSVADSPLASPSPPPVSSAVEAEAFLAPARSTREMRQCYVTVHVEDSGFSSADEYVVSTTANGQRIHGE